VIDRGNSSFFACGYAGGREKEAALKIE